MDTCICMAESACCPPETITTLLISYTPTENRIGKNPPCKEHGFHAWSRKIPHAAEQLSPSAWSPCSPTRETTTVSSPHSPQLEKARVQQQRSSTAKNKFSFKMLSIGSPVLLLKSRYLHICIQVPLTTTSC